MEIRSFRVMCLSILTGGKLSHTCNNNNNNNNKRVVQFIIKMYIWNSILSNYDFYVVKLH